MEALEARCNADNNKSAEAKGVSAIFATWVFDNMQKQFLHNAIHGIAFPLTGIQPDESHDEFPIGG